MSEWVHIHTSELKVSDFHTTQVGQHRKRLLQPWFHLTFPTNERVLVNGRPLLWAMVDALFPNDSLPRLSMLESMKADPPQFADDLQAFFHESEVPVLSLLLGDAPPEMKNPILRSRQPYEGKVVEVVVPADSIQAPHIEDLCSKIGGGVIVPFDWKDRSGVTRVPSLVYGTSTAYGQVIDVGKRVVVVGYFLTPNEKAVVRPFEATVVAKTPGWLSRSQTALHTHYEGAMNMHVMLFPSGFDPIPTELYSMERFSVEHRRSEMGF